MIGINYHLRLDWKGLFDYTLDFDQDVFLGNEFLYNEHDILEQVNFRMDNYVDYYKLSLTSVIRFYYNFERKAIAPSSTDVIK